MFSVFYIVNYTGGFYSFNSQTSGVSPCSANPPKSLHDWKQKFFYIRRGVIPIDMHYHDESEGILRVNVSVDFVDQEWYKTLTQKVTSISQIEERALVGAGMSMLWVPKNPRGVPVFGYKGKGISVAVGAMAEAILAEGKPVWLDQIRDHFLHPTNDSFAAYANTILGDDNGDEFDDTTGLPREEVIVLSNEGSDRSRGDLIPRSPHAGPALGVANEPVDKPADDIDLPVETAEQLQSRKKKRLDKSEKKVQENVAETPHARDKRVERDPDDDETLTEIMKKRKALEDKKKELDEQAAAALAAKKSKLQKETPPAPSESEVDLGVFSAKRGNLLEKIYAASGSQGVKSDKAPRKVDISKITPPTSPPSRTFDLSPPHDDRGKRKEDDVEVEQVEKVVVMLVVQETLLLVVEVMLS
ncbi:hypothetical protein HanRHA438_Chr11g0530761 [Helianthus annuus]|nr:hypothetical protein HanIR_Chr11g0557101 [Helianthus annuus]KAJ0687550.1 hypothetical protein HanLR1_Chr11g0427241 [Helianthus annuus]KAJ0873066.1 hypothetical protein HanRHA438_Chr11g0530761 [Helianthus annuus]